MLPTLSFAIHIKINILNKITPKPLQTSFRGKISCQKKGDMVKKCALLIRGSQVQVLKGEQNSKGFQTITVWNPFLFANNLQTFYQNNCNYTDAPTKGVKVNSIAAYLRSIRAIYNKAIKSELANMADYPFNKLKLETEDTPSRSLSIEEMKRFVSEPLPENTPIWHHRNYFVLSFCLVGINYADSYPRT